MRLHHRIDVVDGIPTTMQYTKTIPRPVIVEKFFEFFFSTIDVHDHYRQGSLAIEREWITHTWWHRTFGTIFGICVVDAYLASRYESDKDFLASTDVVDFTTFMDLLAHQLIHNIYISSSTSLRRRSDESASVTVAHVEVHYKANCYCIHFYVCVILLYCRIECNINYGALQSFLCTRKT